MPTNREKMLAGALYDALDPELLAARERARNLCQDLNATREADQAERRRILRELLGAGGDDVWIQPPFFCDYGSNTSPTSDLLAPTSALVSARPKITVEFPGPIR